MNNAANNKTYARSALEAGGLSVRPVFWCTMAGLVAWVVSIVLDQQHATKPFGIIAPQEPMQYGATSTGWNHGDVHLRQLGEIQVHARVLSTEHYYVGRQAKLSPIDLALGWAEMSDQRVLDQLSVTQGRRWYWLRPKHENLPVSMQVLQAKSANMHIIPGTELAIDVLRKVRAGDVVRFSGVLVEASWPDGARWRSSVSRTDTGDGACELVWVRAITIEQ